MTSSTSPQSQQSVAILGTGLSTLTTAYYLSKFNYNVSIYDYLPCMQSIQQYSIHSNLVSNHLAAQPLPKPAIFINTFCKGCPVYTYRHPSYNTYNAIPYLYWRQLINHSGTKEYTETYNFLNELTKINTTLYNNITNNTAVYNNPVYHIYTRKRMLRDIRTEQTYRRTINPSVNNNERIIDTDQLVSDMPSLTGCQGDIVAALHSPQDYITDLQLYSQNMYQYCHNQHNIQFVYNIYPQSIIKSPDNSNTIQSIQCLDNQLITADQYIINDSIVCRQLLPVYYTNQSIQLIRQHTLRFTSKFRPGTVISKPEQYIDITQLNEDSDIIVTYQRELINTPNLLPDSIDTVYRMNDELIRSSCIAIQSIYPQITVDDISNHGQQQPIVSLTSITPDGIPLIGAIQPYTNLYCNLAHGMYSNTLIQITALLIAQIVAKQDTIINTNKVNPNRVL